MGSKFKYNFSKKLLMKVNKLTDSCEWVDKCFANTIIDRRK
jgi:hypothetical protein